MSCPDGLRPSVTMQCDDSVVNYPLENLYYPPEKICKCTLEKMCIVSRVCATPSRSICYMSCPDGLRPSVTMQCDDSVVNYPLEKSVLPTGKNMQMPSGKNVYYSPEKICKCTPEKMCITHCKNLLIPIFCTSFLNVGIYKLIYDNSCSVFRQKAVSLRMV